MQTRPTTGLVGVVVTLLLVLCLAAEFSTNVFRPVACSSAMKRLYEDLFSDYNRLILPVANNKSKVQVTLGLKLGQILDLNLKQQILSTNVWVEQTWHDYKLQWEPEHYEGIDMIHVPAENIWIPDIVLFNNADGNYELTLVAKARLYSNGTVVWKPPTMFRSTCEIDVEYFPFDIQTCFLRFGSWTYAGDELELRHVANKRKAEIGIDLSQFYKNVEWDIIDVPAYYNEVYYECCTEPFPDITFKIVIRRKMLFYLVNLILPVALMTFMTVSVFYLPSDSNEKVTLSISILTSLIVFFLLMLEIIPASSLAVPLFGKYLLFTLVLVSLSACVSVYVLNIHHRSPSVHSMSPRIRYIFLKILPRILRLNRPDPRERSSLNRFRKKKIAQQLLKQSSANKVYDLAQPLAASLNLIETLHKSYDFNPKDDTLPAADDDDEGRYFRRYVDNYIERLKEEKAAAGTTTTTTTTPAREAGLSTNRLSSGANGRGGGGGGCCEHNKCCPRARQPLQQQQPRHQSSRGSRRGLASSCCGGTNMDWTESSADMMCPLVSSSATALANNKFGVHTASMDEPSSTHATCNNCPPPKNHHRAATLSRSQQQATGACPLVCHPGSGQAAAHHHLAMLNDDTLDMTFDYDDQDNNNHMNGAGGVGLGPSMSGRCSASGGGVGGGPVEDEELPSPPPPPRQLTQLSDTIQSKSGRASSCSHRTNPTLNNSSDESCTAGDGLAADGGGSLMDHGRLVDKLINSIHLINNASDEIDSTTTTSNIELELAVKEAADKTTATMINGSGGGGGVGSLGGTIVYPQQQQQSRAAPSMFTSGGGGSELLMDTDKSSGEEDLLWRKQHQQLAQRSSKQQQQQQHQAAGYTTDECGCNDCFRASLFDRQQQQLHSQACACKTTTTNTPMNRPKSQALGSSIEHGGPNQWSVPHQSSSNSSSRQQQRQPQLGSAPTTAQINRDFLTNSDFKQPSDLLLSLRLSYDQMPAHVRAAIRSILFIADTIKNEDDENSAIEDWESMSMVVDRLFLWIFFLLCTFGSIIILALAPSLYDQRASIDDKLRIDIPLSNCSASVYAH